jgi:AbrB family looped-hinge helix DNA binding protein
MKTNEPKMLTTTFTTKGQVVIPKKLRTQLGIEEGTEAIVREENGCIILQPINQAFIGGLRGRLGNLSLVETLEAERGKERRNDP